MLFADPELASWLPARANLIAADVARRDMPLSHWDSRESGLLLDVLNALYNLHLPVQSVEYLGNE